MSHAAWLRQAESDLESAKILSGASQHSQAVWFAAQAVEKAYKAILAALGLRYMEKHFKYLGHNTLEISNLLPQALNEPLDPQIAEKVSTLESRAGGSRYPAPSKKTGSGPEQLVAPADAITESQQDVESAKLLLGWCRERVTRAVRAAQAMKP